MKRIAELVYRIDEELEGAQQYAEDYIYFKSTGDSTWANKFKTASQTELEHSIMMHDYAQSEIDKISGVYKAPEEMVDAWKKTHSHYVDKLARVKMMLQM